MCAKLAGMSAVRIKQLSPGDPFPWFRQRCTSSPSYAFDTVGGRYILLCFFGSAGAPAARLRLEAVQRWRGRFDDEHLAYFGVSVDPADEAQGRVAESLPGIRQLWDADRQVSRLCGALPQQPVPQEAYRPMWLLLDPDLRVREVLPFAPDASDCGRVQAWLDGLPPVDRFGGLDMHAPVLMLPRVFEPELCAQLMAAYELHGGEDSGFMRDVAGKTTLIRDPVQKVRRDHLLDDPALKRQIDVRVHRRVASAIQRFYCFDATRMERYLVACYSAEDGGHFRPHRDNTTRGTAHRRFALSVNLNAGFEGGELEFPEFGTRRYVAPPGAGIVFPCGLLHGVRPVRAGRRFAFLPFLYDEAAAAVREANAPFLAEAGERYRAQAAASP